MRRLTQPVSLAQICQAVSGQVKAEYGATSVSAMATLASAGAGDLSFLTDARYKNAASDTAATAVLITADNAANLPQSCIAIVVDHAYLAFAKAAQFFEQRLADESRPAAGPDRIDVAASVARDAILADDVTVAAGAVIQTGAMIASGCRIGPNVTIGERVSLGERVTVHPNVTIYPDVAIGNDAVIHANSVLGADGFGFARQGDGWAKIPQLGGLRIGERCEIGSNTSLDRGALDDTVVGNDCVIDNLVQIAHNVQIGDGSAIAGCVGISGSVKIGRRCLIGGGVGFNGHIEVADDVMISPMTFVTKSIREAGFYSGTFPIMPNKQWERAAASIRQLPDMRSKLRQLEKISREIQ
ncbi:MAG: UDP-3-O-(3-hydroxymyristoyl)glucosamine N-acyltransferase [Burkholderiaceae bacterium]